MSSRKEQGIDLRQDRQALQRLREAAEKAKIELSSMMETEINLPYITADANGPKHLVLKLTRAKFEQMTEDLLDRCRHPFENALKDAGLKASDLNEVVLVGGSTPYADGAGSGAQVDQWQGTQQGRQPR